MSAETDRLFEHSCRPDTAAGVCRSRGGESCAFDGAMIVLQCIADAAHLVHGPIACFGNSWESRGTMSDKGILHKRAYTTDMGEIDIVYGAEKKLADAIRMAASDSGAKAVFVYSTCVSGLIGEDMDSVCGAAQEELGIRVVPVHAPGFIGPKNLGNRVAGQALIDHVIGTAEPDATSGTDVNLIGEYNIAGDLWLVEPVLKKAGINVSARITGNSTFEEITCAHRAKLNVVVCGRALINVAREMESKYGIPYVEVSFYGKTEMSRMLRAVADALGRTAPELAGMVGRVVAEEEAELEKKLAPYAALRGKKAVLYTGGVKSWSFISALMDLGIEVVAVGAKKSTAEDEEKMKALLGPDAPIYEDMAPGNIRKLMKEKGADILVAGGRNQYLAIKEGFPFIDVNQERHSAYAGYDGIVNLAGNISAALGFYDAGRLARKKNAGKVQPVKAVKTPLSVNPLKHSPAIGAAMAMQGVDSSMTVLHGAQGCNFLGKVLLTKQFREPISMVSTKLFVEDVVMGSEERLIKTVEDAAGKNRPEVVGVITTGLVEVKGEDTLRALKGVTAPGAELVHISAPDYDGGLEEGYAAAVERLAMLAEPGETLPWMVNVIAGCELTPADVNEIRDIITGFGLTPAILPDLSALDGGRTGFSPLATGGITLGGIREMGRARVTLVIGRGLARAGRVIEENCGVPCVVLDTLTGLCATDRFFAALTDASGLRTPERCLRERRILVDGMRDAMAVVSGKRVAVASEAQTAVSLTALLAEMNAVVPLAVVPVASKTADGIIADEVVVGDFGSVRGGFDLLIASSHGRQTAAGLGVPLLEWGFPVFERLGYTASLSVGYRGTLDMVNRIGNALMEV